MPSFFKQLLLGKDLSNPYVNPYHPGHRANSASGAVYSQADVQAVRSDVQHQVARSDLGTRSQAGGVDVQAVNPAQPGGEMDPRKRPRPQSPTFLEEARRLAGRDPVTGRKRGGQSTSATGSSSTNTHPPTTNPDTGRDTATQTQTQASLLEERRMREQERARAQREVGGYFAPVRPVVREYYGGS